MDEAVGLWGSFVEEELAKVDAKSQKKKEAKQEAMLKYLLTGDKKKLYADPGKKLKKGR